MKISFIQALVMVAVLAGLLATPSPAEATSGFGCYRVNVGPSDALTIRSGPSASTAAIASYHWGDQPIIALAEGLQRGEGIEPSLFDVHVAEFETCVPANLPLGARWCPVSLFGGGGPQSGWLKRRFVDHSECP